MVAFFGAVVWDAAAHGLGEVGGAGAAAEDVEGEGLRGAGDDVRGGGVVLAVYVFDFVGGGEEEEEEGGCEKGLKEHFLWFLGRG